jgi:hypothetical protein
VHPLLGPEDRPNECWDICNTAHLPEDYATGDADHETKLARAIQSVRSGEYTHLRCPDNATLGESSTIATPAEAEDLHKVLKDIEDAQEAAEKAKILASVANRSVANGTGDVAKIMRIAAEAEAVAAEKATHAAEEMQNLVNETEHWIIENASQKEVIGKVEANSSNQTAQGAWDALAKVHVNPLKELHRQISEALIEARNDFQIKDTDARAKRAIEAQKKVEADCAKDDAKKAKTRANMSYEERAIAAEKALEALWWGQKAKAATKAATVAAANASDARLW